MFKVFYSNTFQELKDQLVKNIEKDIRSLNLNPTEGFPDIFRKIPVICGNYQVKDYLSNQLADCFSIIPGLDLTTLSAWLSRNAVVPLSTEIPKSTVDWQIFWALNLLRKQGKAKDIQRGVDKASMNRLLNYVEGCNPRTIIRFSNRLANLYTKYSLYRQDWLFGWTENDEKEIQEKGSKLEYLKNQPDYEWQHKLWHLLTVGQIVGVGNLDLKPIEYFTHLQEKDQPLSCSFDEACRLAARKLAGEKFHLFMPFGIQPIHKIFIKELIGSAYEVCLYIWIPAKAPLSSILSTGELEKDSSANNQKDVPQYVTSNTHFLRNLIDTISELWSSNPNTEKLSKLSPKLEDLWNLKPNSKKQGRNQKKTKKSYEPFRTSYLSMFQEAVLSGQIETLPNKLDGEDDSIKVFIAPTLTRELEAIVDWLHFQFGKAERGNTKEKLKVSDIAIAVPDINECLPTIKSVMESLPDNMKLKWKTSGNSSTEFELANRAFLQLGRLLDSEFNRKEFIEWLELPINRKKWDLTIEDVSIISLWLRTAGFNKGLSRTHLEEIGEIVDDFTLEDAIERLAFGYFTEESIEIRNWGDVLPIFGDEKKGWNTVSEDQGLLFKTLVLISEKLISARNQIKELNIRSNALNWRDFLDSLITDFFDVKGAERERAIFKKNVCEVVAGMEKGLPEGVNVSFSSLWQELELSFSPSLDFTPKHGAITFASAKDLRGVPFKILILAGFNESSGFPGKSRVDAIDLTENKELERKGDPNQRDENKEIFLDLLMSARETLAISYSIGLDPERPIPPSSSIEDFKRFLLSNASKEEAKRIWEQIEVIVPLSIFSPRNFNRPKLEENSPRQGALEALESALELNYPKSEKRFVELNNNGKDSCAFECGSLLQADELIDFLVNPDVYTLKKIGMYPSNDSLKEEHDWFVDEDQKLWDKKRFTDNFSKISEGYKIEELIERTLRDPSYGISEIRGSGGSLGTAKLSDALYKIGNLSIESNNGDTSIELIRESLGYSSNLKDSQEIFKKILILYDFFKNIIELNEILITLREEISHRKVLYIPNKIIQQNNKLCDSKLWENLSNYSLDIEFKNHFDILAKTIVKISDKIRTYCNISKILNKKEGEKKDIETIIRLLNEIFPDSGYKDISEINKICEIRSALSLLLSGFESLKEVSKGNKTSKAEKIALTKIKEGLELLQFSSTLSEKVKETLLDFHNKVGLEILENDIKSVQSVISELHSKIPIDDNLRKIREELLDQLELKYKIKENFNSIVEFIVKPLKMLSELLEKDFIGFFSVIESNSSYENLQNKHLLGIASSSPISITVRLSNEIQELTQIKEVCDTEDEMYVQNNEILCLYNYGKSKPDKVKAVLRHIIWIAADKDKISDKDKINVASQLLHPSSQQSSTEKGLLLEGIEQKQAIRLVELFVQLYFYATQLGLSLMPNYPIDKKEEPKFSYMTLWRGYEYQGIKKLSEDFFDLLSKFGEPETYGKGIENVLAIGKELCKQLDSLIGV